MKTAIIRIPKKDYDEIQKIANNLKINVASAYQLWKRKNKIGHEFEWKAF